MLALLTKRQCEKAGLYAEYEEPPNGDLPLRPDGLQLFSNGKTLTDTTVRHPTAQSYLVSASRKQGHAVHTARDAKHTHYRALVEGERASLYVLGLETYGFMHPEYRAFLKRVAGAAGRANVVGSDDRAQGRYLSRLIAEVSVCLQRGNAHAIEWALKDSRR